MTSQNRIERTEIDPLMRWSLAIGIVVSIGCIVGAIFDPQQFFRAYLFTWLFYAGLSLGGLALVMIQNLTGGAWAFLTRRLAEALMKTLPLLAVLFVPIVSGLAFIYPWVSVEPGVAGGQRSWQERYLDPTFFCWRAAAYFAVWLALAWVLSRWSRQQDEEPRARTFWLAYKVSGLGLVLFAIALHFSTIDWIMSLEPEFTSTILGPLVFSGQLLSAYALVVLYFCRLLARPQFENVLSSKVLNDLGSLLLTLVVLWVYMVWFEFLLIWIADLPRGGIWYQARSQGAWKWLIVALTAIHFVIPFFLLLFRRVKQDRRWLGGIAALVFSSQVLFQYWQVMPAFDAPQIYRHWMDITAPIGMGGIWFACNLWLLERSPLLPVHDLNYAQAVRLYELDREEAAREEALNHA
jgi:hypothetical protein